MSVVGGSKATQDAHNLQVIFCMVGYDWLLVVGHNMQETVSSEQFSRDLFWWVSLCFPLLL